MAKPHLLESSLLALFGCDADRIARLEEGVSTETDVGRAFGEPASVAVQPGQSRAEARARLGCPARMQRCGLKNEEVWDWRLRPAGQTSKLFSVRFAAAGGVTATAVGEDPRDTTGGPGN